IWRLRLKDYHPVKSFFIKQLRIILLSLRGFTEDKCQLRASALTFYSLLSIVPVVAMAFGIAKGFGFEKLLEKQLLSRFTGQEEVMSQVFSFARSLLENTRGGVVAGIGVALLFWTVVKVLGNIEKSFNDIWGVKQQRNIGRKFSDYLSIMLICPILIILSSSATVFITTQVQLVAAKIDLLGFFSPLISFSIKILPYCVIWILFTFIYIFMPNTKINIRSGLLGGIVAGTIYQFAQWAYIAFQVGMAKYNAIYGSFAALPLFLVWLQLSWLIVFLGAEISFAHQNVDTYEFEPDCLQVSYSFKKLLSLRVANLLVKDFSQGKSPLTDSDISRELDIPVRLVRQIIYELTESDILSEVKTKGYKQTAYQPAREIDTLTIQYVVDALERRGTEDIPVARSPEMDYLSEALQAFKDLIRKSAHNKPLKDI
ncbi:MAG: YihY family inner membrane protein, partial [Candidatus Omnitrophica bacterium]|nr:YihY family inner membrane protein [Candidatus Omnitrophota bacterium]MBD3269203.1 YihY family inner membrane protein [Candidatus Omnitrophota bacterium]